MESELSEAITDFCRAKGINQQQNFIIDYLVDTMLPYNYCYYVIGQLGAFLIVCVN